MAGVQLSGLNTGIDTASIVQQLMEAEQYRLNSYQEDLTDDEEKLAVIEELETKLGTFKSALNVLNDASQLRSFNAKSTDEDVMTVSASSNAYEGSHSVDVKQLATSDRWVFDPTSDPSAGFKYSTEYVGEGTFIFSYDSEEVIVETTDETTLEDLVNLINDHQDNPGVTASLLEYDGGDGENVFHLVISGQKSGADYEISINSSNTEVHRSETQITLDSGDNAESTTELNELDSSFFTGSFESGETATLTVSGTGHDGTAITDYAITVNEYTTIANVTDAIEDAFGGQVDVRFEDGEIIVTDTTTGASSMSISLAYDGTSSGTTLDLGEITQDVQGGTVNADLAGFTAGNFTQTQVAQDALIRVDGYPTASDPDDPSTWNWISRSSNTVDDIIAGVTLNLHDATGNDTDGYESIEVSLVRDTETLVEDMNSMIEAYNDVVMYIDEQSEYDDEAEKSGILSSDYTLTSIESLIKNPLILNADGFTSNDTFINPSDIGLSVDGDGILELDTTEFEEAIVDDYLGVLALIGAAKTGATDSSVIQFSQASSYTEAGEYDVEIIVSGGEITSARIKNNDEDWSDARDMEIDGNSVYGSTDLDDDGQPIYDEYSMALTINLDNDGTYSSAVSIRQGFAGALYDSISDMIKTGTGRVSIAIDTVEDSISSMEDRIEDEMDRLEDYEATLTSKYARLEATLTDIQNQFAGMSTLTG